MEETSEPAAARHLYVHIPFCSARCAYCDFASEPVGPHLRAARVGAYFRALRAELARRAPSLAPALDTVYVGGGTPTAVPPELLLPWLEELGAWMAPGGEFTVEANPDTLTLGLLRSLEACGVTRLSLGVQSFSAELCRNLGRRIPPDRLEAALAAVRAVGWPEWNLDLVFGIPGQDWRAAAYDLDRAVAVGPTHISLYDLTYTEAYDRLVAARLGERARSEAEAFAESHYAEAVARLEAAGYRRYEVSNFALPGHECRHNLAYWRGCDYVGLGAAAVGTVGRLRRRNPPTVRGYLAGVTPEEEVLTPRVRLFERAMLGLRTAEGVPEWEVRPVLDPQGVEVMVERGLLVRRCATLSLSPRGLDLSTAVLAAVLSPAGGRVYP